MQIIRGTTPLITANVRSNINLNAVNEVWAYIYQQGRIIVDKKLSDSQVNIDAENRKIKVQLTQEDTLALRANTGAIFQMRLIMGNSNTALATNSFNVMVREVYKDGIIRVPNQNSGGSTNE